MSEGAWIAIATAAAGVFGVIIAAVLRLQRRNNNIPSRRTCAEHSGILVRLDDMREDIREIKDILKQAVKK